MSYLVLGSSGLIGKTFCKFLKNQNKNVFEWDIKLGQEFDLRNTNNMNKLSSYVEKVDYILFAAYDVGGSKYIENIELESFNNNLQIMLNTFPIISKKKFIFLTSQLSALPNNKYGLTKNIGEKYTEMYKGLNVKLWNVYGYEEEVEIKLHVISDFINMALNNKEIKMLTDGKEKRQFLYDEDCSEALYIIFDKYDEFKKNQIIDLTSYEWSSVMDVANHIKDYIPDITIKVGVKNSEEILREPNNIITKYWKSKISLKDGLIKIIEKHKKEVKTKEDVKDYFYINNIMETTLEGRGDSDQHLMTLFSIVLQLKAKKILELGVRDGATTLPLLLGASKTGGKVYSVDIEDTSFRCPDELKHLWEFNKEDAISYLNKHDNDTEQWDLVYIDDWHAYEHVKKELEILDKQISPKTIILLHDLMYANYEPHYHCDLDGASPQWKDGGPYRAVCELDRNFWEFSTIAVSNGLTILRKKYSKLKFR